jgi:hypothetical protein
MSDLRVTIVADGMKREFTGSGSGAELVAAFRSWLACPDFWFPMCAGADEIDLGAEQLVREAAARAHHRDLEFQHDVERGRAAIERSKASPNLRGGEPRELVSVWDGTKGPLPTFEDRPGIRSTLTVTAKVRKDARK